jgi:hypothetical protein
MVEGKCSYRAPMVPGCGGDSVYVKHLGDKGEVRPIVRHIAKRDERHIERDSGEAGNPGKAGWQAGGTPRAWTNGLASTSWTSWVSFFRAAYFAGGVQTTASFKT